MLLEGAGCSLGENRFERQNRERFLFYAAAVAPKDYLVLTYPSSDLSGAQKRPSIAVNRILKLLPGIKPVSFGADASDYLYSRESAAFYIRTVKEKALKNHAEKILINNGITPGKAALLFEERAYIKANKQGQVLFSPSSIERYNYCPFSYFTAYELKLRKNQKIKFATPEIGTFIHKIPSSLFPKGSERRLFSADEDEIKQSVNALAKGIFKYFRRRRGQKTSFLHTYENLKKDFEPAFA
jgi:ATP-dependent helicase/nuclease subunit B